MLLWIIGSASALGFLSLTINMWRWRRRNELSGNEGAIGSVIAIVLFIIAVVCLSIACAGSANAVTPDCEIPAAQENVLPLPLRCLIVLGIIVLLLRVIRHLGRRNNGRIPPRNRRY